MKTDIMGFSLFTRFLTVSIWNHRHSRCWIWVPSVLVDMVF